MGRCEVCERNKINEIIRFGAFEQGCTCGGQGANGRSTRTTLVDRHFFPKDTNLTEWFQDLLREHRSGVMLIQGGHTLTVKMEIEEVEKRPDYKGLIQIKRQAQLALIQQIQELQLQCPHLEFATFPNPVGCDYECKECGYVTEVKPQGKIT